MRKLLIVSGGTKGIGRSVAEKFAKEGFDIITCARNQEDLLQLKEALKKAYNSETYIYKADLSKREEVSGFIKFIEGIKGEIEVLINNTGVFIPGQIHDEKEGVLEQMIETNLYSAYHLTRGIVGKMITKKRGTIFNICSTASITPYPNGGSYCISKYAMYGMTKVLREEMKEHGIRVTAILPGATYTASWEGVDLPEERFIKSEDIGNIIYSAYQLSENAVVEDILVRPQLGDIK